MSLFNTKRIITITHFNTDNECSLSELHWNLTNINNSNGDIIYVHECKFETSINNGELFINGTKLLSKENTIKLCESVNVDTEILQIIQAKYPATKGCIYSIFKERD